MIGQVASPNYNNILNKNNFLDKDNVRTHLFCDLGMTLGPYVKGPNNTIYREWARKAGPWSLDGGLVVIFMEAHMKVGLARIARLHIGVARRV